MLPQAKLLLSPTEVDLKATKNVPIRMINIVRDDLSQLYLTESPFTPSGINDSGRHVIFEMLHDIAEQRKARPAVFKRTNKMKIMTKKRRIVVDHALWDVRNATVKPKMALIPTGE